MATIGDVLAKEDGTQFAIALSDLVFPRYDRDGFAALTSAERVAYCVDALEREIANGGFDQYFWNSSGDTAHETLAALLEIGAAGAAALLREAIAAFPAGKVPANREERQKVHQSLPQSAREKWHELDGRFDGYPDDLSTLMRGYAGAHAAEFRDWP